MSTMPGEFRMDWGWAMVENYARGMAEGLGHRLEDDRCVGCGDTFAAIKERIALSRTEQLLFGDLRCSAV